MTEFELKLEIPPERLPVVLAAMREIKRALGMDFLDRPAERLKRLRYFAEFVAPLFPRRKGRDFIDALKPVQEALGLYNDESMALEAYRGLAQRDPLAWFGVGWLTARRPANAAQCQRTLEEFAKAKPFWP